MKATLQEIEKYLSSITQTPKRIAEAVEGVDDVQLHFKADKKS